jgi:hypothetical protein
MNSTFFSARSAAAMQGDDAELAYANAFGGKVIGGLNDGGHDVRINHPVVSYVQVKSSVSGVLGFFKESLHRHKFIPVCLGEPGSSNEMLECLEKFGAWIGKEIPNREKLLQGASQVRTICMSA